jgi:hypothetical protein
MFGGRGGFGPNPKTQLVQFVTKLDQLTQKPLAVTLDDKQKAEALEQLKGLGDMEELDREDAQKRLDKLLKLLDSQKETFKAAGYRWPEAGGGGGGFRPPVDLPNPFTEKDNKQHLEAFQKRLTRDGT